MSGTRAAFFACIFAALTVSCGTSGISEQLLAEYLKAKETYSRGDLPGAETALRDIVARKGTFHQAAFLLGKTYYFEGKLEAAERVFNGLIRKNGGYNEAEIWLVRILMQKGDGQGARKRLERLLERDAEDPRLLYLMGLLSLQEEDLAAALGFFQRTAFFGEELARAHLESARLYHQFGQSEKALSALRTCLALTADDGLLRAPVERLIDTITKSEMKKGKE